MTRIALWLTEDESKQWINNEGEIRREASERMVHMACALRMECVLMLADHTVVCCCPGVETMVRVVRDEPVAAARRAAKNLGDGRRA
jgi:hypothetical protein